MRRLLEDHPSTKVKPGVEPVIGGRPWTFANGQMPRIYAYRIAIDP